MGMAAGAIPTFMIVVMMDPTFLVVEAVMVMDIGGIAACRGGESQTGDQLCWNWKKSRQGSAHRLPDQPKAQSGDQQEAQRLKPSGDVARHAACRAHRQDKHRHDGDG